MDRYREFGALQAMGVTPWEVVRLIVTEIGGDARRGGRDIGPLLGASATLLIRAARGSTFRGLRP